MNLFPPPDKSGQIKFFLGKNLPYKPRMLLTAALLSAGLGIQLTLSFWAGLALLLAASLLGMVKGYDSGSMIPGGEKWERVTPDEYAAVRLKAAQLRKWDEALFDITDPRGALAFAAVCVLCAGLFLFLASRFGFLYDYWTLVAADAFVILLPLWFTGVREYLRKDRLIIKIELLERMMKLLASPSEVQVFPLLALAGTEGGAQGPVDARFLIKLVGAPPAFYGIQVQVSISSVQGSDFPYLYCVLAAKPGSGLLAGHEKFTEVPSCSTPGPVRSMFSGLLGKAGLGLTYEAQKNADADMLVVRQKTVGNSGCATPEPAAAGIVTAALALAKRLLAANTAGTPR